MEVNLNKYAGLWFEIDSFKQIYERDCIHAVAYYKLNNDGTMNVRNICFDKKWKPIREIQGTATQLNNNKFHVSFPGIPSNPTKANYIILATDYKTYSVVGTEDKNALWILARENHLNSKTYKNIVKLCYELGYDVSKLQKLNRI